MFHSSLILRDAAKWPLLRMRTCAGQLIRNTASAAAGAALFLASPLASYVVGQTLVVDGGLIL